MVPRPQSARSRIGRSHQAYPNSKLTEKNSQRGMSEPENEASSGDNRGFRFFFWLSASLFILAGANWLFNDFIGISNLIGVSGPASYLLGIFVLILPILMVAMLLSAAYRGV